MKQRIIFWEPRWLCLICSIGLALALPAQQLYTSLDVLRPGKVTFEQDALHLLLVNNTVAQPREYGHQIRLLDAQVQNSELNVDSAALFCLAGLAESIDEIGYFASVSLLDESQNKTNRFFEINRLKPSVVDSLCNLYEADAIVALNRIALNDVVSDFQLDDDDYAAAYDVRSISSWSVHYPNKKQSEAITFADSLFWETTSSARKTALDQLPNREDALIDASIYVGRQTATRILPRWETVDRYFYVNKDKLIKQGIDSVYYKKWKAAITLWQQAYNVAKSKKTQAYAAADMAVAYEILGNLDLAIEKANIAMLAFSTLASYEAEEQTFNLSLYLQELMTRQKEVEVLQKQL